MKRKIASISGVVVVVIAAWLAWGALFNAADAEIEYFTSAVLRSSIENTIVATGNVEAMVTVEVGSQVTGQVQTLYANFNSVVTEGQILARLDPRNVQTQLRNAQANLRSVESRIVTAKADRDNADVNLESARANLTTAQLDLDRARKNLERSEALFADELVAETDVESARTNVQSAEARIIQQQSSVQQAEAQIVSRDAAIEQAEAALEQAQSALEEARLNVGYTEIRSPVDGVVISRKVDVGQTVSASTSAPTLFLIANDLSRMRVQASIDEADIGLLGRDNEVTFRVDAYPSDEFRGSIEEIRLNPSRAQNVVTYAVIVSFDNPDLRLKPGMTANITISVDRRDNVISVPNTALRYTPPGGENLPTNSERDAPAGLRSSGATPAQDESVFDANTGKGGGAAGAEDSATILVPAANTAYMPGQEWQDTVKIQFQAAPPDPPRPATVWVLNANDMPEPRSLMVGLTDGSRSEVVSGQIAEGEQVVIGDSSGLADEDSTSPEGDDRELFRMMRGGFGGGPPPPVP